MKIAVCDDEKIFRKEVIQRVQDAFGKLDCDCAEYADGREFLRDIREGRIPDAVFLDIEMPGMDGMQTAVSLRQEGIRIPVIFLTSHTEFAMQGYEVEAFRFLEKPIRQDRISKTLEDLKRELYIRKRIMIRSDGEDVVIPLADLVYLEAQNNDIRFVLCDREYRIRRKLSEVEKELMDISDSFCRIHRGYVVNLGHVKRLHGNDVHLTGDVTLPVGRLYRAGFKERLFAFVRDSAL